jgi:predicted Zn-ribbon and HTH transcriptional regulator
MLGRAKDEQRETYARGQWLIAGETVIPGRYRCRECGWEHIVEEGKITSLPVCPRCQGDGWDLP